jgi:hypothetical protein
MVCILVLHAKQYRKEKLVIDSYYNQRKNVCQIAQEARISFRDISAVIKKQQGRSFDQGGFGGGGGGRTTAQCTDRGCPETVNGGFGGGGVGGGSGRGGQESCLAGVQNSCTTINGGGSFP